MARGGAPEEPRGDQKGRCPRFDTALHRRRRRRCRRRRAIDRAAKIIARKNTVRRRADRNADENISGETRAASQPRHAVAARDVCGILHTAEGDARERDGSVGAFLVARTAAENLSSE